MRIRFGTDQAWELLGPAWPLLDPSKPKDSEQVRAWVLEYWTQRLSRVRSAVLSPANAAQFRSEASLYQAQDLGAGYEILPRIAAFQPVGFWFLDLGVLAWIAQVRAVRGVLAPGAAEDQFLVEVERVWRLQGAEAAWNRLVSRAEEFEYSPSFCVYHIPLSLWQKHDLAGALRSLDRLMSRLGSSATSHLGLTLPLTLAMCHALRGDPLKAASFLEGELAQSGKTWSGEDRREIAYHRARYLWAANRDAEAVSCVVPLFEEDPAFLLRFCTDPAWGQHPEEVSAVYEVISERAESIRNSMIRWQRNVLPPAEGEDPFAQVRKLLRMSAADLYPLFAAVSARSRALEAGAVEPYRPPQTFFSDVRDLREFLTTFPLSMPLRLHPSASLPLVGEDSEVSRLERGIRSQEVAEETVLAVSQVIAMLPQACRVGLYEHGRRLVDALATAIEIMRSRGEAGAEAARTLYGWAQECLEMGPRLSDLPRKVDRSLGNEVQEIWKRFSRVEQSWAQFRVTQHGQLSLDVAVPELKIPRNHWATLQFTVRDWDGAPVPGTPVVWRIARGPAAAKEPNQCLMDNWALTLQAGGGYISVVARGEARPGERGELQAWVHGFSNQVKTIPFVIV